MKYTDSHVPQFNDEKGDYDYHYSREERKKLMNAPRKRKYNKKLKYLILILDMAILFGVYQCVRYKKNNENKTGNQPAQLVKKSSLLKNEFKYTFVSDQSSAKGELRLIVRRRDQKLFVLPKDNRVQFVLLEANNKKKTINAKQYDLSTKKIMHIFYINLEKKRLKSLRSVAVRYIPSNRKDLVELILE